MMPEHWQKVEQIYNAALECKPDHRQAFLDESCAGDNSLRREVESLLACQSEAKDWIESPAVEVVAKAVAENRAAEPPPDLVGRTLLHYRIDGKIGEGGMGVVYRAFDTLLHRRVAIKLLPPNEMSDVERRRRFLREARAASALNHPNIITIHDICHAEGTDFIAMEYVEGRQLAQRIGSKGMPLGETLGYAIQIADALDRAHQAGIVHRDLKPSNIMVAEAGNIKVLDFGLAKVMRLPDGDARGLAESGESLTGTGAIIGTAAYMSPEQCQGKRVDARSDIFAFGSVLYEMVTGRRAFQGDTPISTIAAIIEKDPIPASEVSKTIPPELDQIIGHCLRKDPERRVQHMSDVKVLLQDLKEESERGPRAASRKPSRIRVAVALSLVLLLSLIAVYWMRLPTAPPRILRSSQLTNDGAKSKGGLVCDGSTLYFTETVGSQRLLAQVSVMGGQTARIPLTFPDGSVEALLMDVRPDRHELLLRSTPPIGTSLLQPTDLPYWVLPLPAGAFRRLGDLRGFLGARWSPDGDRLAYIQGSDLCVADAEGNNPNRLVRLESATLGAANTSLCWAPDGKSIRFGIPDSQTKLMAVWEVSANGSGLHRILPDWTDRAHFWPRWTPDGKYFVFNAVSRLFDPADIWAIPEKKGFLRKSSPVPVQLTFGPISYSYTIPSPDGKKLFAIGTTWRGEPARCDHQTGHLLPYLPGLSAECLAFSSDGSRLAYVTYPKGELWRSNADGSQPQQLVRHPMQSFLPRWSPDGKEIAFIARIPPKQWKIYLIPAEGGMPEQLIPGDEAEADPNWSPDGSTILYGLHPGGGPPKSQAYTSLT